MNVLHQSKLYSLCIMNGDRTDLGSFLATLFYSATTSTVGRIIIRGIITSIARSLGFEPNPEDRVLWSEHLKMVSLN